MIPTKFHPIETRALGVTPSYVPRWAASIPGGHFLANEIDFIRNDFDGHAAHCTACADLQHQLGTEWPSNFVVRIQGPDFCAGAVFDLDRRSASKPRRVSRSWPAAVTLNVGIWLGVRAGRSKYLNPKPKPG